MKNVILLLSTMMMLVSCVYSNTENSHQVITFVNKTHKTLYVLSSYEYPDTDVYKQSPDPKLGGYNKVEANQATQNVLSSKTSYENLYHSLIPSGVMMVYVFDGSTLETKGWDYVKANNLVLKRYDLTLQDLKNMNWVITYDGN
ncbi:Uncharacterised protein [Chryseobacterium nakagawai]|uniref:Lipoprotein n=1 Tax=Chryseobacterium nakagawai TaxID=1241982 RepID=A0AAD0YJ52_CHRNA|nr:hypothetical protein [Chryseobacterium nakagawai]AZA90787.1 hypothetical protein EG343_09190 [Chryseobacterium nakagawai]VEH22319.1 Uncharacterised protein [Chryseobacterium nakagawai]